MQAKELLHQLKAIIETHGEAADAEVWAVGNGCKLHVSYIGFDKRHRPARLKLEE